MSADRLALVPGTLAVLRDIWLIAEIAIPSVLAYLYLSRCRALSRAGRPRPASRQLCFGCGLLVVFVATGTGIETLADDLLTAHMVQHLLLADVAALLLAVGLTGPVLRPLLCSQALRWLTPLANPVIAVSLFTVTSTSGTFRALPGGPGPLPCPRRRARSLPRHRILLWLGLFRPLPKPAWFGNLARVGYAACIWLPAIALANIFMWSGTAFYPAYEAAERARGVEPVADQSTSGAVLMVWCACSAVGIFAWVILRWAQSRPRAPGAARPGRAGGDLAGRRPGPPGGRGRPGRPPSPEDRAMSTEANATTQPIEEVECDVKPQAAKEERAAEDAALRRGGSGARRRAKTETRRVRERLHLLRALRGGGPGHRQPGRRWFRRRHAHRGRRTGGQLQGIPQADTVLGNRRGRRPWSSSAICSARCAGRSRDEIAPQLISGPVRQGDADYQLGSCRSWALIRSTPRRRRWPPATWVATGSSSSSSTGTRVSRTPATSRTPSSRRWPGRRGSPTSPSGATTGRARDGIHRSRRTDQMPGLRLRGNTIGGLVQGPGGQEAIQHNAYS